MTASAPITTAPEFTVQGELSPTAITAIARLLIAYARSELEAERAAVQDGDDEHGGQDR